jgi:pterin-4a-carbinolamine dehydratase
MNKTIYTIGHSTHPIDEFINILHAFEIGLVVDIRMIPKSRHNPQFNQTELEQSLQRHEIGYLHLKELGGLRHTTKASVNTGWRNSSFRGYADYMQTEEFRAGIEQLIKLAETERAVIMCAEAVPWRCHRSLIGDALVVRDIQVEDIMSEKSANPHNMTPWAKADGVSVTYPEPRPATEVVTEHEKSRSGIQLMKGDTVKELAQLMHCSPVEANTPRLSKREIGQLKEGLPGWETHEKKGELRLEKSFQFDDFSHALAFTDWIAQLANEENHHPAILTEWGKATVTWWTHKIRGLHKNDFIMAAKTDQAYREVS